MQKLKSFIMSTKNLLINTSRQAKRETNRNSLISLMSFLAQNMQHTYQKF